MVLNGTRRNLNDEYKDRIASCLSLTLSQLYSEEFRQAVQKESPVFLEDPDRRETTRMVETFLAKTNLENARTPFYTALAILNDREAYTLRSFLSSLLQEMVKTDRGNGSAASLMSLAEDERSLLAIYSIAGDGARLEWVRAASDLSADAFGRLAESLSAKRLIAVTDNGDGLRSRTIGDSVPASSIFAARRLKEIHLALAGAMQQYADEGPFFEESLARHLTKAGKDAESVKHLKNAAQSLESAGLWHEAAARWHQASIVYGILDSVVERSNCLADAARCLCATGESQQAGEFGSYACRLLEERGLSRAVANVCVMMGNMLRERDLGAAIKWYEKGITVTPLDLVERGILLVNLASASLDAGKLDDAENSLMEASRWVVGRNSPEVKVVNLHVALNMGLIEYQRRNWKQARVYFESCLEPAQDSGDRLDTVWHNLGMLMYRDDNVRMAREYLTNSMQLYWERGYKQLWAYAAVELAKVALRAGDLDEALRQVAVAEPYLEEKSLREKGWVFLVRACVEHGRRRLSEAMDSGRKAVDVFQRERAERDLACAAFWLSSLFAEAGDAQQSQFMERRAFQIYEKRHWDIRELHRERSLLEPEAK